MNTTFNAKEAVKYMLDGLRIKPVEPISFGDYFIEYYYYEYGRFKFKYGIHTNIIDFLEFMQLRFIYCLADKKLVKWYRPIVLIYIDGDNPYIDNEISLNFFKSKKEFFDTYENKYKVLEWEEKYFPETWEQCE